jgi:putative heme iron utilization protein
MNEFRAEADELLRARRFGILSTMSEAIPGYPFGSLVSYAVDAEGRPLLLLSGLALHTQNAAADPRVSLTVFDPSAEERPEDEDEAARATYLERHPEAKGYSQFGDFAMYRIAIRDLYFVGGFGRAGWASSEK